jgi:NTP pyrophosphatase (non-canonical NTP hydrolase)
MEPNVLTSLINEIRNFADERDWHKFHTPKNLSMALAGEVGELLAEFQWLTPEQSLKESLSEEQRKAIELEIADVQIYLLRLVDVLGIDLPAVVREKIQINSTRF